MERHLGFVVAVFVTAFLYWQCMPAHTAGSARIKEQQATEVTSEKQESTAVRNTVKKKDSWLTDFIGATAAAIGLTLLAIKQGIHHRPGHDTPSEIERLHCQKLGKWFFGHSGYDSILFLACQRKKKKCVWTSFRLWAGYGTFVPNPTFKPSKYWTLNFFDDSPVYFKAVDEKEAVHHHRLVPRRNELNNISYLPEEHSILVEQGQVHFSIENTDERMYDWLIDGDHLAFQHALWRRYSRELDAAEITIADMAIRKLVQKYVPAGQQQMLIIVCIREIMMAKDVKVKPYPIPFKQMSARSSESEQSSRAASAGFSAFKPHPLPAPQHVAFQ